MNMALTPQKLHERNGPSVKTIRGGTVLKGGRNEEFQVRERPPAPKPLKRIATQDRPA